MLRARERTIVRCRGALRCDPVRLDASIVSDASEVLRPNERPTARLPAHATRHSARRALVGAPEHEEQPCVVQRELLPSLGAREVRPLACGLCTPRDARSPRRLRCGRTNSEVPTCDRPSFDDDQVRISQALSRQLGYRLLLEALRGRSSAAK
jgi:hypothetical protein